MQKLTLVQYNLNCTMPYSIEFVLSNNEFFTTLHSEIQTLQSMINTCKKTYSLQFTTKEFQKYIRKSKVMLTDNNI